MRAFVTAIVIALIAYPGSAALGQLAEGERIRVTYDANRSGIRRVMRGSTAQSTGALAQSDSSRLSIVHGGRSTDIEVRRIRRVEISEGRHRRVAKYALLGALTSAGAAAVMHFAIAAPMGAEWNSHNRRVDLWIVGGGAVAGALAGVVFPEERWRRVTLP